MSRVISVFLIIIFLFTCINITGDDFVVGFEDSSTLLSNSVPIGARGLTTHSVIRIDSNTDFITQATNENWPGQGTSANPYIIENYLIDAAGKSNGIYIGNITRGPYFIIKNCTLTNASGWTLPWGYGAGITINNCQYGILENNNCTDNKIGICLYGSNYNTVHNNNCSNNTESGIFVDNSDYNTFINNNCSLNDYAGIFVTFCRYNIFESNICNLNRYNGIELYVTAQDNQMANNSCNFNNGTGISLETTCNSNVIYNNTCIKNDEDGISLEDYCSQNFIDNNTCNHNLYSGIYVNSSDDNDIQFNDCINNSKDSGIVIELSALCKIDNNTCKLNNHGIYLNEADTNNIRNNTCVNNSNGILLYGSDNNNIFNNSFNLNLVNGIKFIHSSAYNYIKYNNISNNQNGINLTVPGLASVLNVFSLNKISYNSETGVFIDNGNNNEFYYNNILFNQKQAVDKGTNQWNNNYFEGNYWSDYTGLDNGSGGRIEGDGIGDTDIPHLSLDNYPFTDKNGWFVINPPKLYDPGILNNTGSYNITWDSSLRAILYILEEDTNIFFDSPNLVFSGTTQLIEVTGKSDGIYYYRLKIRTKLAESQWSNVEDIIVDLPPNAPTGLTAKNPTGRNITLSWDHNSESDILDYHIFINDSDSGFSGPFHWIKTVDNTTTETRIAYLIEETTYYFKILAFDKVLNNSTYSNVASNTTTDETAPDAPSNLTATALSNIEIKLTWVSNTEPDLAGYIIYINDSGNGPEGKFHWIATVSASVPEYIVSNLLEDVTYYFKIRSFDEVPNNSSFSDVVSTTTLDQTAPGTPTGFKVTDATYSSLTLSWNSNTEPDLAGYNIYMYEKLPNPIWQLWPSTKLNNEPITETIFVHTGLEENTRYFYKLQAVDMVNNTSELTDFASGKTPMIPRPPFINNSMSEVSFKEDTIYRNEYVLYWVFSDPNNDNLTFRVEGATHININLYEKNGTLILMPDKDWNGVETLTIYANDSIFEISFDVNVEVIGYNDPPGIPEIIKPQDGIEITEGEGLIFQGRCFDSDLPYGDELVFKWISSIDDELGRGANLTDVRLSKGNHVITLEVSDMHGEKSTASINVSVVEKSEESTDNLMGIIVPVIIIIIIILVLVLIFLKRRKKPEVSPEESELGPIIDYSEQPPTEQTQIPEQQPIQEPQYVPVAEYTLEQEPQAQEIPPEGVAIEPTQQQIPETTTEQIEQEPGVEPMPEIEGQAILPPSGEENLTILEEEQSTVEESVQGVQKTKEEDEVISEETPGTLKEPEGDGAVKDGEEIPMEEQKKESNKEIGEDR